MLSCLIRHNLQTPDWGGTNEVKRLKSHPAITLSSPSHHHLCRSNHCTLLSAAYRHIVPSLQYTVAHLPPFHPTLHTQTRWPACITTFNPLPQNPKVNISAHSFYTWRRICCMIVCFFRAVSCSCPETSVNKQHFDLIYSHLYTWLLPSIWQNFCIVPIVYSLCLLSQCWWTCRGISWQIYTAQFSHVGLKVELFKPQIESQETQTEELWSYRDASVWLW